MLDSDVRAVETQSLRYIDEAEAVGQLRFDWRAVHGFDKSFLHVRRDLGGPAAHGDLRVGFAAKQCALTGEGVVHPACAGTVKV